MSGSDDVELPDARPPSDEVETTAFKLTFDHSTLRWVRDEGAALRVAMARRERSSFRLVCGPQEVPIADVSMVCRLTPTFLTLNLGKELGNIGLEFADEKALTQLHDELVKNKSSYERFEQYDPNSVQSYFQYYGKLSNQQNMLQDHVRTGLYRKAIMENMQDFSGKAVMDIGAGSGILSFFSAQAGASTVYAIEASSMAEVVRQIADKNDFGGCRIEVVNRPVESIRDEVTEKVDVLVSEPIGTFLFNERMIESYLIARDKFLRPGGKMYPSSGDLCVAPFSDVTLHWEQQNKNAFWKNTSFYDIDLTAATARATKEYFRQPIVDYINPECLVSQAQKVHFDFLTCTVESLHEIEIPFDFPIHQPCLVHGLAGWFDAQFEGSQQKVVLSTAPWCPGTHWYQIRFLLETPLAVNAGQRIEGTLKMEANNLQSYYVSVKMKIKGTDIQTEAPCIDLKDPEYRFYTSPNSYCPPGTQGIHGVQATQSTNGLVQTAVNSAAQGTFQTGPVASQVPGADGTAGAAQQGGGATANGGKARKKCHSPPVDRQPVVGA